MHAGQQKSPGSDGGAPGARRGRSVTTLHSDAHASHSNARAGGGAKRVVVGIGSLRAGSVTGRPPSDDDDDEGSLEGEDEDDDEDSDGETIRAIAAAARQRTRTSSGGDGAGASPHPAPISVGAALANLKHSLSPHVQSSLKGLPITSGEQLKAQYQKAVGDSVQRRLIDRADQFQANVHEALSGNESDTLPSPAAAPGTLQRLLVAGGRRSETGTPGAASPLRASSPAPTTPRSQIPSAPGTAPPGGSSSSSGMPPRPPPMRVSGIGQEPGSGKGDSGTPSSAGSSRRTTVDAARPAPKPSTPGSKSAAPSPHPTAPPPTPAALPAPVPATGFRPPASLLPPPSPSALPATSVSVSTPAGYPQPPGPAPRDSGMGFGGGGDGGVGWRFNAAGSGGGVALSVGTGPSDDMGVPTFNNPGAGDAGNSLSPFASNTSLQMSKSFTAAFDSALEAQGGPAGAAVGFMPPPDAFGGAAPSGSGHGAGGVAAGFMPPADLLPPGYGRTSSASSGHGQPAMPQAMGFMPPAELLGSGAGGLAGHYPDIAPAAQRAMLSSFSSMQQPLRPATMPLRTVETVRLRVEPAGLQMPPGGMGFALPPALMNASGLGGVIGPGPGSGFGGGIPGGSSSDSNHGPELIVDVPSPVMGFQQGSARGHAGTPGAAGTPGPSPLGQPTSSIPIGGFSFGINAAVFGSREPKIPADPPPPAPTPVPASSAYPSMASAAPIFGMPPTAASGPHSEPDAPEPVGWRIGAVSDAETGSYAVDVTEDPPTPSLPPISSLGWQPPPMDDTLPKVLVPPAAADAGLSFGPMGAPMRPPIALGSGRASTAGESDDGKQVEGQEKMPWEESSEEGEEHAQPGQARPGPGPPSAALGRQSSSLRRLPPPVLAPSPTGGVVPMPQPLPFSSSSETLAAGPAVVMVPAPLSAHPPPHASHSAHSLEPVFEADAEGRDSGSHESFTPAEVPAPSANAESSVRRRTNSGSGAAPSAPPPAAPSTGSRQAPAGTTLSRSSTGSLGTSGSTPSVSITITDADIARSGGVVPALLEVVRERFRAKGFQNLAHVAGGAPAHSPTGGGGADGVAAPAALSGDTLAERILARVDTFHSGRRKGADGEALATALAAEHSEDGTGPTREVSDSGGVPVFRRGNTLTALERSAAAAAASLYGTGAASPSGATAPPPAAAAMYHAHNHAAQQHKAAAASAAAAAAAAAVASTGSDGGLRPTATPPSPAHSSPDQAAPPAATITAAFGWSRSGQATSPRGSAMASSGAYGADATTTASAATRAPSTPSASAAAGTQTVAATTATASGPDRASAVGSEVAPSPSAAVSLAAVAAAAAAAAAAAREERATQTPPLPTPASGDGLPPQGALGTARDFFASTTAPLTPRSAAAALAAAADDRVLPSDLPPVKTAADYFAGSASRATINTSAMATPLPDAGAIGVSTRGRMPRELSGLGPGARAGQRQSSTGRTSSSALATPGGASAGGLAGRPGSAARRVSAAGGRVVIDDEPVDLATYSSSRTLNYFNRRPSAGVSPAPASAVAAASGAPSPAYQAPSHMHQHTHSAPGYTAAAAAAALGWGLGPEGRPLTREMLMHLASLAPPPARHPFETTTDEEREEAARRARRRARRSRGSPSRQSTGLDDDEVPAAAASPSPPRVSYGGVLPAGPGTRGPQPRAPPAVGMASVPPVPWPRAAAAAASAVSPADAASAGAQSAHGHARFDDERLPVNAASRGRLPRQLAAIMAEALPSEGGAQAVEVESPAIAAAPGDSIPVPPLSLDAPDMPEPGGGDGASVAAAVAAAFNHTTSFGAASSALSQLPHDTYFVPSRGWPAAEEGVTTAGVPAGRRSGAQLSGAAAASGPGPASGSSQRAGPGMGVASVPPARRRDLAAASAGADSDAQAPPVLRGGMRSTTTVTTATSWTSSSDEDERYGARPDSAGAGASSSPARPAAATAAARAQRRVSTSRAALAPALVPAITSAAIKAADTSRSNSGRARGRSGNAPGGGGAPRRRAPYWADEDLSGMDAEDPDAAVQDLEPADPDALDLDGERSALSVSRGALSPSSASASVLSQRRYVAAARAHRSVSEANSAKRLSASAGLALDEEDEDEDAVEEGGEEGAEQRPGGPAQAPSRPGRGPGGDGYGEERERAATRPALRTTARDGQAEAGGLAANQRRPASARVRAVRTADEDVRTSSTRAVASSDEEDESDHAPTGAAGARGQATRAAPAAVQPPARGSGSGRTPRRSGEEALEPSGDGGDGEPETGELTPTDPRIRQSLQRLLDLRAAAHATSGSGDGAHEVSRPPTPSANQPADDSAAAARPHRADSSDRASRSPSVTATAGGTTEADTADRNAVLLRYSRAHPHDPDRSRLLDHAAFPSADSAQRRRPGPLAPPEAAPRLRNGGTVSDDDRPPEDPYELVSPKFTQDMAEEEYGWDAATGDADVDAITSPRGRRTPVSAQRRPKPRSSARPAHALPFDPSEVPTEGVEGPSASYTRDLEQQDLEEVVGQLAGGLASTEASAALHPAQAELSFSVSAARAPETGVVGVVAAPVSLQARPASASAPGARTTAASAVAAALASPASSPPKPVTQLRSHTVGGLTTTAPPRAPLPVPESAPAGEAAEGGSLTATALTSDPFNAALANLMASLGPIRRPGSVSAAASSQAPSTPSVATQTSLGGVPSAATAVAAALAASAGSPSSHIATQTSVSLGRNHTAISTPASTSASESDPTVYLQQLHQLQSILQQRHQDEAEQDRARLAAAVAASAGGSRPRSPEPDAELRRLLLSAWSRWYLRRSVGGGGGSLGGAELAGAPLYADAQVAAAARARLQAAAEGSDAWDVRESSPGMQAAADASRLHVTFTRWLGRARASRAGVYSASAPGSAPSLARLRTGQESPLSPRSATSPAHARPTPGAALASLGNTNIAPPYPTSPRTVASAGGTDGAGPRASAPAASPLSNGTGVGAQQPYRYGSSPGGAQASRPQPGPSSGGGSAATAPAVGTTWPPALRTVPSPAPQPQPYPAAAYQPGSLLAAAGITSAAMGMAPMGSGASPASHAGSTPTVSRPSGIRQVFAPSPQQPQRLQSGTPSAAGRGRGSSGGGTSGSGGGAGGDLESFIARQLLDGLGASGAAGEGAFLAGLHAASGGAFLVSGSSPMARGAAATDGGQHASAGRPRQATSAAGTGMGVGVGGGVAGSPAPAPARSVGTGLVGSGGGGGGSILTGRPLLAQAVVQAQGPAGPGLLGRTTPASPRAGLAGAASASGGSNALGSGAGSVFYGSPRPATAGVSTRPASPSLVRGSAAGRDNIAAPPPSGNLNLAYYGALGRR
ncbi:hypothetical protein HYH03_006317 [Edaphochlamys debaryana]|uniref:Uncharacterized protein n=1 Tax=Edaphochlamys debaryana TaxID=47281 RepID=A0A836C1B0_9CHLO|nr:hypothetical protein HYH03_006317 [Edaphochlamys debaryana]|eukprot:KAG2495717.1 hypothetical protein HYH03_006317 [Edaphochlamys debaryana]